MWSFLAKYIALYNLHLSAFRACHIGSDLYFLKTLYLFLTIHFCWKISSLNQYLGGHWVTTFVLSEAIASSVDFRLPENLDTSSSKSSMLRRGWVSMAFPKKIGVYGSNFVILQFLPFKWGFWYVEGHFHCKAIWPQWALNAARDGYVTATFSKNQVQHVAKSGKSTHWIKPVAAMVSWNILAFTSTLSFTWMLKSPRTIIFLYCVVM